MARLVPVQESRVAPRRTADGVEIEVPRRRPWWRYFIVAWGLFVVGMGAASMVTAEEERTPWGFFLVWFALGMSFVAIAFWGAAHRETLSLGAGALTQVRWLGPVRRTRAFDRSRVEELRVSPQSFSPWQPASIYATGSVAFDYGGRTIRVADTEEAEARRIVAALREAGL